MMLKIIIVIIIVNDDDHDGNDLNDLDGYFIFSGQTKGLTCDQDPLERFFGEPYAK